MSLTLENLAEMKLRDIAKLLGVDITKTLHKEENTKIININVEINKLTKEDFLEKLARNKKAEKEYNSSRISSKDLRELWKDDNFWK